MVANVYQIISKDVIVSVCLRFDVLALTKIVVKSDKQLHSCHVSFLHDIMKSAQQAIDIIVTVETLRQHKYRFPSKGQVFLRRKKDKTV